MKTTLTLIAATLLAGCQTLGGTAGDWNTAVTNKTYVGLIESGGELVESTTTFKVADDGSLSGGYLAWEGGRCSDTPPLEGALQQCRPLSAQMLQCKWKDKDGEGLAGFVFSTDRTSFVGGWNSTVVKNDGGIYHWLGEATTMDESSFCRR